MVKKIIVEVCAGTHCTMMGSMDIMDAIASLDDEQLGLGDSCSIEVRAIPCKSTCDHGRRSPYVFIDGELIENADSSSVMSKIIERARQTC